VTGLEASKRARRARCPDGSKPGPGVRRLLETLASYVSDENGSDVWPGINTIAEAQDITVRAVKKQLRKAKELGLISSEPRHRENGRGRLSDRITLRFLDQRECLDTPASRDQRDPRNPTKGNLCHDQGEPLGPTKVSVWTPEQQEEQQKEQPPFIDSPQHVFADTPSLPSPIPSPHSPPSLPHEELLALGRKLAQHPRPFANRREGDVSALEVEALGLALGMEAV
jgi:hypothetical protein